MKDIMIATGNKNKVREFKEMLEPLGYTVHDLSEVEHEDVIEDGTTFAENALIKARGAKAAVKNMMAISDDSGISIDFFNGGPGIYSARWLDTNDYNYKNQYILNSLGDSENRGAHYTCAIALIDETEHVFVGEWYGEVAKEAKGTNGFGYDPIFYVPEAGMTSAEMSAEEKNERGHRGQACRMLLEYLEGKNK